MSKTVTLPLNNGTNVGGIIDVSARNLQAQGYSVQCTVMNPQSASMTVAKDNDGFKNFLGLGLECTVSINILGGNQLSVAIESKWTNKIIALVVGWFLCWVPIVTGIIGCVNQSSFPDKIIAAIQNGVAAVNNGQQTFNNGQQQFGNNYNNGPQQTFNNGQQQFNNNPQQPFNNGQQQFNNDYNNGQQPPNNNY